MLIIRRRVGERIVIGTNIEVTVASGSKRVVRFAIAAPKGIPVVRAEVHDAVVAANLAATSAIIELDVDDATDSETPSAEVPADDTKANSSAPSAPPQQEMRT